MIAAGHVLKVSSGWAGPLITVALIVVIVLIIRWLVRLWRRHRTGGTGTGMMP